MVCERSGKQFGDATFNIRLLLSTASLISHKLTIKRPYAAHAKESMASLKGARNRCLRAYLTGEKQQDIKDSAPTGK